MAIVPSWSIATSCLVVVRALLVVPCSSATEEAVRAGGVESTSCHSTACNVGRRSGDRSTVAKEAEEYATAEDTLALEMRVELLQLDLLPQEQVAGNHNSTTSEDVVMLPHNTEKTPMFGSSYKAGSQNNLVLGRHAALQTGEHIHSSTVKWSHAMRAAGSESDNVSETQTSPLQAGFDISRFVVQNLQRNNDTVHKSGTATGFNRSGSVVAGIMPHRLNTTAAQELIQQTLLQTLSSNNAIDSLLTGVRQRMVKVSSEINDTATSVVQDRLGSFEASVTAALDGSVDAYERAAEGVGNVTESLADLLVAAQHEAEAAALAAAVNKSFVILDEALDSLEQSRLQLRGLSKRPAHAAQGQFVFLDQLLTNGTNRMALFGEKLEATFNRTFGYIELLAGLQGTGTFDPLRLKVKHMAEVFASSYVELHHGIVSAQNNSRVMKSKADYRTVVSLTMSLALLLHCFVE